MNGRRRLIAVRNSKMREGEEEELPLADDVSDAPADDDACFTHHRVTHPTAVPDNVWRIHGRDYDLTSFVDEHPGGALFILMGKGLDCTHFFEFYHCFSVPRKRLRQYDVTPDGRKPAVPECGSEFMCDVRAMVREHFGASSCSHGRHKAGAAQLALLFSLWAAELPALYWWLFAPGGSVAAGVLAATINWLLMANLMHDGCHAALSTRPWLNHVGHFLGSAPFGCGMGGWWLQHVISHHPNINQLELDYDAHHMPWTRWHKDVRPERHHNKAGVTQLVFHVVAYVISTFWMVFLEVFGYILYPYFGPRFFGLDDLRDKPTPEPRHTLDGGAYDGQYPRLAGNFGRQGVLGYWRWVLWGNVACFVLAAALTVAPPVLQVWWAVAALDADAPALQLVSAVGGALVRGVVLALAPHVTASLFFMFITQVSHIQEACQSDAVLNEPCPFKRQAQTSLDYSPSNSLVWFITGGLNLQSIHHLLPSVSCVHYPAMYPKFLAICEKHGCVPARANGFFDAVAKHWNYVYRLGLGEEGLPPPDDWPGVRSAA